MNHWLKIETRFIQKGMKHVKGVGVGSSHGRNGKGTLEVSAALPGTSMYIFPKNLWRKESVASRLAPPLLALFFVRVCSHIGFVSLLITALQVRWGCSQLCDMAKVFKDSHITVSHYEMPWRSCAGDSRMIFRPLRCRSVQESKQFLPAVPWHVCSFTVLVSCISHTHLWVPSFKQSFAYTELKKHFSVFHEC